jgi:hypothetical protein
MLDVYLRSIEPLIVIVLGCMRWKGALAPNVRCKPASKGNETAFENDHCVHRSTVRARVCRDDNAKGERGKLLPCSVLQSVHLIKRNVPNDFQCLTRFS